MPQAQRATGRRSIWPDPSGKLSHSEGLIRCSIPRSCRKRGGSVTELNT
jgi:hypothetical protein